MKRKQFKIILWVAIFLLQMFACCVQAAVSVSVNVTSPDGVYNGAARDATKDLYLYGDINQNGYVEYTVDIPQDGTYRLDGTYGLQGAVDYTQLRFLVDGVWLEEILNLPKTPTKWSKETAVLHPKMPFLAGKHKIRIMLCGQNVKSGILFYNLSLTRMGAYEPISVWEETPIPEILVTAPDRIFSGEVRQDSVYLFGNDKYSFAEYTINVEKEGVYRLLSSVSTAGGEVAKVYIAVDGVKLENMTSIPPYNTAWVKRDAVLYHSIFLTEGTHTIGVHQADKTAHLVLYDLYFESTDNQMALYRVTDGGTVERTASVDAPGTYRVRYAQKRMKDGVMIAGAYDNGQLLQTVTVPYYAGTYHVMADLPDLPENAEIKLFFVENMTALKPLQEQTLFASEGCETPRDLYVSSTGSDKGDGSYENPYRTVEKAKETIRRFGAFTKDVTVYIAPGEYSLKKPLVFTDEDSGQNGYRVIYRGQDPENPPIFSGGTKVENWTKAEGNIWKAQTNIQNTRTLYINGNPAVRAKSKYTYESTQMGNNSFTLSGVNFPENLSHPEEMEMVWLLNWTAQRLPITNITRGENLVTIQTEPKAFEKYAEPSQNVYTAPGAEKPFYLENAKELLDEPGEFYFDRTTKEMFYYPYPEENMQTAEVYAGTTEGLVKISGSNMLKKAKNLVFDSLIFRYGAWNSITDDPYGVHVAQADAIRGADVSYAMGALNGKENRMIPAQFSVEKAQNITVQNCELSCLGSGAISMANAVSDSVISGNRILDVAGSGIVLGHWNHVNPDDTGAGMERCENIEVANNVIHRAANEFMNGCGISLYYTKNANVHHNDIRDLPYTGITLGWGWNLEKVEDFGYNRITENHIENVMSVLDDGAHIYTLGDSRENVISGNHLVKAGDFRGGIYLDQGTTGVTISDNVIEQCTYWLHARKNIGLTWTTVENNFFDKDAKYNWVSGTYNAENEAEDEVMAETEYEGEICYNTFRNNQRMTDAKPQKAQEIILAAGLSETYRHLLSDTEVPAWRKETLATVPTHTFKGTNGWHEAENFNPTEGIGYLRQGTTVPISGIPYRPDAPDVAFASVNYWGVRNFVITNTQSRDWFAYDYEVDRADEYACFMRLSNGGNTAYINVYVDGALVISRSPVENTGDYHTYKTVNLGKISLSEGHHTVKFEIRDVGLHLDRWSMRNDSFSQNDSGYDEGK